MEVGVKEEGACRRMLNVVAPFSDMEKEYSEVLDTFSKQARIAGFRKGKAPKGIVESRFRRDIEETVRERVLPRLYREAILKARIDPVAIAGVSDVAMSKEKGLSFNVAVDVAPRVKLPRYTRIPVKGVKVQVEDKAVDDAIERLRSHLARFEDVAADCAIEPGHLAQIDYSGLCEGRPISSIVPSAGGLAEGKDFWMLCGQPELVPGLSAGLTGAAAGQERSVEVVFPADFRVAGLAGKTCVYSVAVKAVRKRVLPELGGEFLKACEVESVAQLRDRIGSDLRQRAEEDEKARRKGIIMEFLIEKSKLDLPEEVVRRETGHIAEDIARRNAMAGVSREQIRANAQRIIEAAAKSSEERVRALYILREIAAREKIDVGEKEVEERIEAIAARQDADKVRLRAEMEKEGDLERLRAGILSEKTLDYLLEQAKVKE